MTKEERRERRKAKKEAKQSLYDKEELRLQLKLCKLEPGTEEYQQVQSLLRNNNNIRSESRESKRRISKADKGGIIIKCLGIVGAAFGVGSIIWAEKQGMTFTGEKRSIMDAISRGIGNRFVKR